MTLLSRAALETYADVHYDDNTTGEIVEEEVRTGYKNLADSAVIKNEAGDLGAGLEWNADVIRIKAAGVTLAMMESRAQATFVGRKAAVGTGAPQEMSAAEAKTILAIGAVDVSGLSAFATSTDLASATGTLAIARIADGTITLAKIVNVTAARVLGRASGAGTGVATELAASDLSTILGLATIATSGSASDLGTGTLPIARIADGTVTLAKSADLAQATVIGRASGAGTGVPVALTSGQLATILGLASIATSGSASDLGTGTLVIARIADGTVSLAKLENRTQATFIGRKAAAGTGVPQEMSASEAKTILAIATSDITGLATIATSGSASDLGAGTLPIARIADGTVTLAKLANFAQATVIGRASGAGTGVPVALAASDLSTILGLSAFATSTDLASATGTLAIARIADATVTLAKLANLAQATVVGRASGTGTGVPTALDAAALKVILGFDNGVWTPALTATGTAPTGVTYSSQVGIWYKIGNVVYFWGRVAMTSKGTGGVGPINVTGLPSTIADPGTAVFAAACRPNSLTFSAGYSQIIAAPVRATTVIAMIEQGSGVADQNSVWANTVNTTAFILSGSYYV